MDEFRSRVNQWLRENVPDEVRGGEGSEDLDQARQFQAALYDAGLAGITWPAEFGGQGMSQAHLQAFNEEAASFALPTRPFSIGLGMCGPTIVDLGSPEQKERHLRPLLRGEEIWCQLFSEPGAGSDVAGLTTRAVRDGDEWLVNGQKIWTSYAHVADFGAALVRTDPTAPKHKGLTMFILDMRQAGVTVRPLKDMSGLSPFNEVFFDDVRFSDAAVLGEVGGGWTAAVTMLGHERVSISEMRQKRSEGLTAAALAERARTLGTLEDDGVLAAVGDIYAQERALELLRARYRQEALAGTPIGARGSFAKLGASMLLRKAVDVAGVITAGDLVAWAPDDHQAERLSHGILSMPASGIAGGTNEIQRNIIAERILGLPREPIVKEA
ncbi:acyl-CoA dehydrogenase family protein [Cumulibacter soli]|uniref:acyl-CoA dehydrogenase family protein n=1 Tax=Cumulibacter soli TaxID=2546344 RepID=UPI001068A7EF|nr:acyl-CoA dehydrogenase family protein [Cumulibacter soli]